MHELSSTAAGKVIGVSDETIRRYVNRGLLPARQQGMKKILRIEMEDLKTFADEYSFRYNDKLADKLSE